MAATNDQRIASATLFAAQVDFTHAGDLKVFVDEAQLEVLERRMAERGYLEGKKMANAFNMLRSNDLIWPYVVNNYLRGKAPMPFDLLYWNSDATRMPAANHSFYLRQCYLNNTLSQGQDDASPTSSSTSARSRCRSTISPPARITSRRRSRRSSARSSSAARCVSCSRARATSPAWSIRRTRCKYQYWTGGKAGTGTLDAWLKKAKEHPGSWWPDWIEWIKSHGADEVPAREPGGGKLTPIEDAPGRYVKVRS